MFSLNFSAGSQHILLISPNHEKEQKIPELLLRFKLQDILNSTYSTISIVAQMAAAEKFNKVYDLPPIIEEDEDVDFIGVGEKNIEVVMSHANVDRGKAVTGYGFEE